MNFAGNDTQKIRMTDPTRCSRTIRICTTDGVSKGELEANN